MNLGLSPKPKAGAAEVRDPRAGTLESGNPVKLQLSWGMGSGRDFLLSQIPASTGLPHPSVLAAETRFTLGRGLHPRGPLCFLLGEKGVLGKAPGNWLLQSACRRGPGQRLARDNEGAGPRIGKMRTGTTQTTTSVNVPRWEAAALRERLTEGS